MSVKDVIKTHPRLYDQLKRITRVFSAKSDPTYLLFDHFSKALGRPVKFIQIGANDGLRNDPIREFIVRDNWSGIFVEPLPNVFELLKENYSYLNGNLIFQCAAVSKEITAPLTFYTFDEVFLGSFRNR